MTGIAHHSAPQARHHHWRREAWKLPIHLMFILISITMIVPLIMIFSISISEEAQILGIGNGSGASGAAQASLQRLRSNRAGFPL